MWYDEGIAPGYVEKRPLAKNKNTSTLKLAALVYTEVVSGRLLRVVRDR